jgi:hypothetical protein
MLYKLIEELPTKEEFTKNMEEYTKVIVNSEIDSKYIISTLFMLIYTNLSHNIGKEKAHNTINSVMEAIEKMNKLIKEEE